MLNSHVKELFALIKYYRKKTDLRSAFTLFQQTVDAQQYDSNNKHRSFLKEITHVSVSPSVVYWLFADLSGSSKH